MNRIGTIWVMLVMGTCAVAQEDMAFLDTSLDFVTRATDLVQRMTLEEKISQLGNSARDIERLGIPSYDWWNECLHGVARAGEATVFPQAIGMAATYDRAMMFKVATAISDEARAKHNEALRTGNRRRYTGLTFWSPNINIFRDPRWGRGHETYGEDPYLTGQMGIQFVKGLQGDDKKYLKVVATAKHFAVHSGPEPDRHHFNAVINARDLWETYLPAFHDLVVEAKVYSVMGAYNRIDGESASASWMLLRDVLRERWGFDGYVVSDCGAISDIFRSHKIVATREEAAALGIRRGCDLNCGRVYQQALKAGVERGYIDELEIDLAVFRLMLARMKLGMFDPPEKVPYARIPYSVNNSPAHDALSLAMSLKSMTLLKNDGLLPLDKSKLSKVAVIGPNAKSIPPLRGNYYGEASHPITIVAGIERAVGQDTEVLYAEGCSIVEKKDSYDRAIDIARQADVVVFVGGLSPDLEGEEMRVQVEGFNRGDRSRIELPTVQAKLLKALQDTGKPVVFVMLAGSSVALNTENAQVPAILMAWYPGQRGGDAVAQVLFGDYNPAGRLPVTFYTGTEEIGDFSDYVMTSGKGKTYRYYRGRPWFPFGHGLSYTTFAYSNLKVSRTKATADQEITVAVTVANTGAMDGEEVVQLYVRDVASDRVMPIKQLRGFERVALKQGQKKTVRCTLTPIEDMRYFDPKQDDYAVEPGEFEIQVGASSSDIRLTQSIAIEK